MNSDRNMAVVAQDSIVRKRGSQNLGIILIPTCFFTMLSTATIHMIQSHKLNLRLSTAFARNCASLRKSGKSSQASFLVPLFVIDFSFFQNTLLAFGVESIGRARVFMEKSCRKWLDFTALVARSFRWNRAFFLQLDSPLIVGAHALILSRSIAVF